MRWAYAVRSIQRGYGPEATTLISTPLYSNTTLVSFMPTLTFGGTVVLMPKFETTRYLELAQQHRVTHTMLVPVQYQRLMAHPEFDRYDLSSFQAKFCTSAPFAASIKADVVRRWPGRLTEYYGMTEGGGSCQLEADEWPTKLHSVGRPLEGHDIRLIDEHGNEVAAGEVGEIVGHSPAMMTGYYRQPDKTAEAEWYDPSGKRFIRTGDMGRFDEDGFLTLLDRKKDMIISGGFNVYPSDLEAEVQPASGRRGGGRGRRAIGAVGRDAGGVRGAPRARADRRRHAAGLGQCAARQDAAACRAELRRQLAAQSDRQGAQARIA